MDGSRWFWPVVVVGTLSLWVLEWALSQAIPLRLPMAAGVAVEWAVAILCGAMWYRADPSPLAASSITIALAALWTVDVLLDVPVVVHVAILAVGIGGFYALASSYPLAAWWYRVILRSRRVPPR